MNSDCRVKFPLKHLSFVGSAEERLLLFLMSEGHPKVALIFVREAIKTAWRDLQTMEQNASFSSTAHCNPATRRECVALYWPPVRPRGSCACRMYPRRCFSTDQ